MLSSFDLQQIQNLLNIKTQELFTELQRIDCDLSEHITGNFVRRTSGITDVNASKQIYLEQDHSNKKYIRNTKCWAKDLDLTCISPWNSYGNKFRAGTAISKFHVVFASHYPLPVNTIIRFITNNNDIVERKIIKIQKVFNTDITIALLDQKLPDSITPAKFLPKNWKNYLSTKHHVMADLDTGVLTKPVPALCLDYDEKANINMFTSAVGNKEIGCGKATGNLEAFSEQIITGDSGNPCFIIIDDKLVLLTTWNFGGYGSGPFLSGDTFLTSTMELKSNFVEIQSIMSSQLLPTNNFDTTDICISEIDLWRFRKVS